MKPTRKFFTLACALVIAGCSQSGGQSALSAGSLSALPPRAEQFSARLAPSRRPSAGNPAVYVFAGQPDAFAPAAGLVHVGSTMYGTSATGGANNMGAVFSVTTGGAETVMHSFGTGTNDGVNPYAPLTNVNGTLYGVTYYGGTIGHGTLFSITPSGNYQILYNFGSNAGDCQEPLTGMIYVASQNALFGVTHGGGPDGESCIFKASLATKIPAVSVFYGFNGTFGTAERLAYYQGAFYGTTETGGANNSGSIFKVTPAGQESVVYSFKGSPDGALPQSGLTVDGNALYGTTELGGKGQIGGCGNAGCGTLFKITPEGHETVLHRFTVTQPNQGVDGQEPQSEMTNVNGTLYGTTPVSTPGYGLVYSLTSSGKYSIVALLNFSGQINGYPEEPMAPVMALGGVLYGTTVGDSSSCSQSDYGCGTVFSVPE